MTKNNGTSDFDPNALTQKTDEHTKILNGLQKRVGTNENFGKTFKEAAVDSKAIDEAVATVVIKLLENDTKTQEAVEHVVEKVDGRQSKKQWQTVGRISLWALSIIAAVLLTTWITTIVNDANTKNSSTGSGSSATH